MQDFRKLRVWESAFALSVEIYRVSQAFPASERFGLTSQLRRAACSIGANIAEGCGRATTADLRRFLDIAMGSAAETQHHLRLAWALGWLDPDTGDRLDGRIEVLKRMLGALVGRLGGRKRKPAPAHNGVPRPAVNREPSTVNDVGAEGAEVRA